MSIPEEELGMLRQQLRASISLLIGYCDQLLHEPETSDDAERQAALEDALAGCRRMRDLVSRTLSRPNETIDPVFVSELRNRLAEIKDDVVRAITVVIESQNGAPLPDYYAADAGAVRDIATYLLHKDPVESQETPDSSSAAAAKIRSKSGSTPSILAESHQNPATDRKTRILVAEDAADTRRALVAHLRKLNHEVVAVENGRAALEEVVQDSQGFDLVLSDLEMPEMTGFDLLQRLKTDPATRDIPVIVISGFDDMPSVVRCIEQGAEDHLPKPFERVLLNARVTAAIDKKLMRDKEVDYLHRVERVIDAARAVESGGYEPGALSGIGHRADELGRLARVFDSMVAEVRNREDRLQNQIGELRRDIRATREVYRLDVPISDPPSLATNHVFAGRYEIIEELGRGGMGMVYRALDRELGEEVAVKTLRGDLLSVDAGMIERLKTELRLARSISHRNVVRSFDFGEFEGTHYLTMEYVEGITLRDLIDSKAQLGVASTLAIGTQLADALAVAHDQGVIHRDIKPRNLLLDDDGVLKVMDFGIARPSKTGEGFSYMETGVGSPRYMAPEQLFGEDVTTRADLYSAGVVLYECLVGEVPFDGPTPLALAAKILEEERVPPRARNSAVPPALSELVMQILERRASRRLGTASELGALLRQIE